MTFDKINRRTHLYLGMMLTPWFLLYGASAVILNHGEWFKSAQNNGTPEWKIRFERSYRLPPIADDSDASGPAEKVLSDSGLTGRYRSTFPDDGNLVIQRQKLWPTIRLTHYPREGRLKAEDKRFHLDRFLTAAHFRAGFAYPYFIERLWAILMDVLVFSTLAWIASGLYMWIKLKRFRFWGWMCLAGGMATFVIVIWVCRGRCCGYV